MLVFAVTVVFAATDIMALVEPKWKSAVFGFYFLSGAIIAALAAGVVSGQWVQSKGLNRDVINNEHYQAIGKLLFSFTVLWAYLGFCQLLPIWYRNASEEMAFYTKRSRDGWRDVMVTLVFSHLVVPVVALLCRDSKRNCRRLLFLSVWMLAAHYLDLYCLIMPNYDGTRVPFGLLDVLCWLGCAAVFFAEVLRCARVENTIRFWDPSRRSSAAIKS
jgi:Ni/Fe-hydrogenase subunit HybB-like protein